MTTCSNHSDSEDNRKSRRTTTPATIVKLVKGDWMKLLLFMVTQMIAFGVLIIGMHERIGILETKTAVNERNQQQVLIELRESRRDIKNILFLINNHEIHDKSTDASNVNKPPSG